MTKINRRQAMGCVAVVAATAGAIGADSNRLFTIQPAGSKPVDDTVRDAVDQLLKVGGGTIYFPSGNHRLARPLNVPLPAGVGIAIRGDGPGLTRLTFAGEQAGIVMRFSPQADAAVVIEGMSVLRGGRHSDSAVRLVCEGGSSPMPRKLVRDLCVAGADGGSWALGIDAVDCTFLTIEGLDFAGGGTAVRLSGDHDPVDNYVSRLRVTSAKTGIEVLGASEGVYGTQSTMIGVERGVHWHTPHGEPLLSLSGCHIAASRDCVLGHNLIQPIITGNLFYQSPDGGEGEWAGVRLSADRPSIYDLLQVCEN
jgi:hypothetical protein